MEKNVLDPVLLVAMGHVTIKMDHATIVKKVGKVIALKVVIHYFLSKDLFLYVLIYVN